MATPKKNAVRLSDLGISFEDRQKESKRISNKKSNTKEEIFEKIDKRASADGSSITISRELVNALVREHKKSSRSENGIIDDIVAHYGDDTAIVRKKRKLRLTVPSFQQSRQSSDVGSMSSSDFYKLKIHNNLDIEKARETIKKDFDNKVIKPALGKEEITYKNFKAALGSGIINNKNDVIKFLSLKKPKNSTAELNYFNLKSVMSFFEKNVSKNTKQDFTQLKKEGETLKAELESVIINAPQFIGRYLLFTGQLENLLEQSDLKYDKQLNMKQIGTSSKTFLEALETANLVASVTQHLNTEGGYILKVKNPGAAMDKDLFEALIDTSSKDGRPRYNNIEDLIAAYEGYLKNRTSSEKLKDLTSVSSLGVSGSGRFSKDLKQSYASLIEELENTTTGDITLEFFKVDPKDMKEIKIFDTTIDAKFGTISEYSSQIKSFGKNEEKKNLLDLIFNSNVSYNIAPHIQTYLTLFVLYSITGHPYDLDKEMTQILKYAFVGSSLFLEKFRKEFQKKGVANQVDLIAFIDGYIWFSDFFKYISSVYFDERKGSGVRYQPKLSESIIKAQTELKNRGFITDRNREIKDHEELIKELKKITTYDEDIQQVFEKILKNSIKIEYRFNLKDTVTGILTSNK